jgi:DNA-binding helix-hairpin-helix protein with protein kinase domain
VVFVDGQAVALGEQIGAGGQARLFALPEDPRVVARMSRRPDDRSAARVRRRLAVPLRSWWDVEIQRLWATWPLAGIELPEGQVAGMLLPRLDEARYLPLCDAVDQGGRLRAGALTSHRWSLRAAVHLAHAVHRAQALGFLASDLSSTNVWIDKRRAWAVLLDPEALLTLEEVTEGSSAVSAEIAAPEQLRGEPASAATVAWALGVQIFRLLMEGQHPFAGVPSGRRPVPDQLEENIRVGSTRLADDGVDLPDGMLDLGVLPVPALALARRCFVAGHDDPDARPEAWEWVDGLAEVDATSGDCSGCHLVSAGESCRWCGAGR